MPVATMERPKAAPEAPVAKEPTRIAQINARISAELKAKGDAALAKAGFSPTAAIRALWSLAASHADDPEGLRKLLDPTADGATRDADAKALRQRRLAALEAGSHIFEDALAKMGLSAEAIEHVRESQYSDEELLEQAYLERYDPEGIYA